MLITFTSKAAAEVTMYKEHAKRILDLLHKDIGSRGVITAAEATDAVKVIEREITETRLHTASEDVRRDVVAHHGEAGDDTEHEGMEAVSFSARAYPLLEMLRAAKSGGHDVLWSV
jgi:hypothetical protein